MTTTAIGNRNVELFSSADILLRRQSDGATTTIYLANRSWRTNPSDTVAPHRQYVGLLIDNYSFDYSWFKGDALGGKTTLNRGILKAINPDGPHSLEWIFAEGWLAVSIVHRMGEIGEDLAAMLTRTTACRATRPSNDSFTIEIDLADDGQLLDTSMLIDRLQGYGDCVRFAPSATGTVASDASLAATSAFYVDVAYRLPSWADLSGGLYLILREATGGGHTLLIHFRSDGFVEIHSRTAADATVTLTTDLEWVADGRCHRVVGKWDNTTDTLRAFHSTRTGGALSTVTAAQTTIKASTSAVLFGDVGADLTTHEFVDIAQIAYAVDANVPTDDEIIARLKRPLTEAEIADCALYLAIDENTGTETEDGSGNANDATIPDAWYPTFEGTVDLAGTAKQLLFGRRKNARIQWTDEAHGQACVHSRCYKGIQSAFEGAGRRTIGWVKHRFYGLDFDSATKTISFPLRTNVGGADRLDAQPGFAGLVAGQLLDMISTLNTGTYTVVSSTERSVTVSEAIVDDTADDAFITARGTTAKPVPNVTMWHDAGGLVWSPVPTLPVSIEALGDIGAETPTDDPEVHFPEYTPAIMRTILEHWGGIPAADISDNWDNGVDEPANPIGGYFARAGVWLDPKRDRDVRDVLDEGGDTLYARWGQDLASDDWDIEVIDDPPVAAAAVELTALEILSIERVRSMPPVGGYVLRGEINDVVLDKDQVVGNALAADKAELQKPHLEGRATLDTTVVAAFPHAETPKATDTWFRYHADVQAEAQRRYDLLKIEHEVFRAQVVLFGLDKEPMRDYFNVTDEDFSSLVAGKNLWGIHLKAADEIATWTLWGVAGA